MSGYNKLIFFGKWVWNMGSDSFNAVTERERNTVGKEIARMRNRMGLSQPALCERMSAYGVKVQAAAISKWEKGENVPHAYQLLALCHALEIGSVLDTFCSKPLLNREGLQKLENYRADLIASGRYQPQREEREEIRYVDMPVSYLSVSAGPGEFLDENGYEMVSFPESSIPEGAELGVRISGDSMEPVYHDGQIVWIQRCKELRPSEVGIFFYDGNGYLKVYSEREANGSGRQPVLVSYNRRYEPISVLPEREFRIAGRVLKG